MKDNDKMSTLERLRISCGYTQKGLAEEAGVSVNTIKLFEKGDTQEMSSTVKRKISSALGCPSEALDNKVVCDCWIEMSEKLKLQQKLVDNSKEMGALRNMVTSLTQEVQSLRGEVADLHIMIEKIAKHFK